MYEADRTWIFERLKRSLQLLACRAVIQLNNFPNFVAFADEMALDFENFRDALTGNFRTELTAEQASCLDSLDRSLSELSIAAWSNGGCRGPSRMVQHSIPGCQSSARIWLATRGTTPAWQ